MRSMHTATLLSLLLGCLLGVGAADAGDRYPCSADDRGGKRTIGSSTVIDHDYIVRHTMGPHSFDIPYGYIIRRPPPEWVDCPGDKLTFAFWMPDLRAPKDDMWSQPNYRVQEPGRSKPGMDEFIVKVWTVSHEQRGSPANSFGNIVGGMENPY